MTPHVRTGEGERPAPRQIGAARRDAIAADTCPLAHSIAHLAKKHGVAPHTIARNALLLANALHRGRA